MKITMVAVTVLPFYSYLYRDYAQMNSLFPARRNVSNNNIVNDYVRARIMVEAKRVSLVSESFTIQVLNNA